MNIYFVRHGESEATALGPLAPAGHDLPLTETGRKEADAVARYFASNHIPLGAIYASSLVRAQQTAEPTARALGLETQIDARLRERDWGSMNTYTWSRVAEALKLMPIDDRYRFVPEGGESWEQMEVRVLAAMHDITEASTDVAVFTHGGVLRGLLPVLAGVGKERHEEFTTDTGAIAKFSTDTNSFEFVNLKP